MPQKIFVDLPTNRREIVAREMIIKPSQKLQAVWCYIIKMVLSATL